MGRRVVAGGGASPFQSSTFSPGTRWNSVVLCVTSVTLRALAWPAISTWQQASANKEWLSLRNEILLNEARVYDLLKTLKPADFASSETLSQLLELAGKNKERHARMAKDLHQMLSIDRVLEIMDRLGVLIRENVHDPKALMNIQMGLEQLMGSSAQARMRGAEEKPLNGEVVE